jgi:hypothetical protein
LNYFNYYSEIEETFVRRRGKHLLLSPLDWALIEVWQERSVPLHIVVRGIEKVFDDYDKRPRRRSVKSLFYCREEIEAQYGEWLERQVGKNGYSENAEDNSSSEFSDDVIRAHLKNVSESLSVATGKLQVEVAETIERVISRLEDLSSTFADAESLEKALGDLEKLIDAALLKLPERTEFETGIEEQMRPYRKKMEADSYRQTVELMLLKRLREHADIPRLSLFYL